MISTLFDENRLSLPLKLPDISLYLPHFPSAVKADKIIELFGSLLIIMKVHISPQIHPCRLSRLTCLSQSCIKSWDYWWRSLLLKKLFFVYFLKVSHDPLYVRLSLRMNEANMISMNLRSELGLSVLRSGMVLMAKEGIRVWGERSVPSLCITALFSKFKQVFV